MAPEGIPPTGRDGSNWYCGGCGRQTAQPSRAQGLRAGRGLGPQPILGLLLLELVAHQHRASSHQDENEDLLHNTPPTVGKDRRMVGLTGLEPVASSLSGKRSNRLSYRPVADPARPPAEGEPRTEATPPHGPGSKRDRSRPQTHPDRPECRPLATVGTRHRGMGDGMGIARPDEWPRSRQPAPCRRAGPHTGPQSSVRVSCSPPTRELDTL